MAQIVQTAAQKYSNCKRNNPKTANKVVMGVIKPGNVPGEHWQTDLTELPRKDRY